MHVNTGANSYGTQVNRYLDSLGLPDQFGDKIGAMIDLKRGDLSGFYRNIADLNSGLSTKQFDAITGARGRRGFSRGCVHRARCHGPHLHRWSRTYAYRSRVGTQARVGQSYKTGRRFFGLKLRGRISGRQYRGSFRRPIRLGKSGYLYRGKLYRNMSAIRADLRDGRADGVATKYRTVRGSHLSPGHQNLSGLIGRAFTPGWNPANAISNIFKGISNIGNIVGGAAGAAGAGGAGAAGGADSSESVLSNPNLTLEDKLMLLMAKLSKHMDKQIEDKMKQIESAMKQQGSKKSGKSGGGMFGGIFKAIGGIAGTAFGGPIGGMIGNAAGGILGGLLGGGGGKGGAGAGGANAGKKPNLQLLQSQLQSLMQKRQQMFQTMTNIMKSLHDTSMAAIRNLKA